MRRRILERCAQFGVGYAGLRLPLVAVVMTARNNQKILRGSCTSFLSSK